jgi:hypothetical protein
MGQTVYVLMLLEGKKDKEWRPVAVVTNPDVAAEWQARGKDVDWVPLELDDIRNIEVPEQQPTFQPRKVTPNEQKAIEIAQQLQDQNKRLQEIVKKLEKRLGIKEEKPKQPIASLLKKKE